MRENCLTLKCFEANVQMTDTLDLLLFISYYLKPENKSNISLWDVNSNRRGQYNVQCFLYQAF